jgi:hypothetical protein
MAVPVTCETVGLAVRRWLIACRENMLRYVISKEYGRLMLVKKRILVTVAWIILGILISGAITAFLLQDAPRREWNARAGAAGSFAGLVIAIGCGAIWLPWAARIGAEKRKERERKNARRSRKS